MAPADKQTLKENQMSNATIDYAFIIASDEVEFDSEADLKSAFEKALKSGIEMYGNSDFAEFGEDKDARAYFFSLPSIVSAKDAEYVGIGRAHENGWDCNDEIFSVLVKL